ncbi:MAG: D-alanyl-D-alanine carboxypeptidase family protein [Thermoleophilia bacterium]
MNYRKYLKTILLMAVCFAALAAAPAAAEEAPTPPVIGARSVLLVNADNGQVLFSQNPDQMLPMASTTKIMTALIIIEDIEDLQQPVTVSQRAAEVGESSVWLTAGEQLTVEELLKAMLIQSGNDAAAALAEFDAGSIEAFAGKMNARAAELGMESTHFVNPHGLDDPEHYTTASDFIILAQEFRKHPELMRIVACSEEWIPDHGQPDARYLINHNHLLDIYPVINGIKTGFTDAAGQCIVTSAEDKGVNLLLAYLGAESYAQRNDEVISLVDYGFSLYREETVIGQGEEYATVGIPYDGEHRLSLVAEEGRSGQVFYSSEVEYRLMVPAEVVLPVRKGDRVGLVSAYESGVFVGSSYLLATEDVEAVSWTDKVSHYFGMILGTMSVVSLAFFREVITA